MLTITGGAASDCSGVTRRNFLRAGALGWGGLSLHAAALLSLTVTLGVQKQRPAQYQGLYLATADGKVLASHQNFKSHKTWPREVLADLEPGLKAFGAVKPREAQRSDPLPRRGSGVRSDGGATPAIYLRYSIKGIPLNELPNPTIDSLPLTAKQLAEIGPPSPKTGVSWEISE